MLRHVQRLARADADERRRLVHRGLQRVRSRAVYGNLERRLARGDEWVMVRPPRGVTGERYLLSLDDRIVSRHLLHYGEWEYGLLETALDLLGWQQVDVLIDVGANVGSICLPALHRGRAVHAVAVEPDPRNCALLRVNALLNGVSDRIAIHQVAAAADDRDLLLGLDAAGHNHGDHQIMAEGAAPSSDRPTVVVRGVPLDSLVASGVGTRLLWMDVQGYEFEVLRGASNILRSGAPMVMEFSPLHLERHGGLTSAGLLADHYVGCWDLHTRRWYDVGSGLDGALFDEIVAALPAHGFTDLLFLPRAR